jgi:hypothetical protein
MKLLVQQRFLKEIEKVAEIMLLTTTTTTTTTTNNKLV